MFGRFESMQCALSNRDRNGFGSSVAVDKARVQGVDFEANKTTAQESAQQVAQFLCFPCDFDGYSSPLSSTTSPYALMIYDDSLLNIRRRCGSHACQSVGQAEWPGFPQSGDCGYHRFGECLRFFHRNLFEPQALVSLDYSQPGA